MGIALCGARGAEAQAVPPPIDLIGVTAATFEWQPASGAVAAYLIYVAHDDLGFPPYPEAVAGPTERRVTVRGKPGDRLRVRVAAMGPQLAIGPFSPSSDPVRFLAGSSQVPPFDFTGDGVSELLLQDTRTGLLSAWDTVPSPFLRGFVSGQPAGALWDVIDASDFDGDGMSDLLWRDPATGRLRLCRSDGRNASLCADFAVLPASWTLVPIGDTNGDGLRDVVVRDARGDRTLLCLGTGTTIGSCGPSLGAYDPAVWTILAPGDVDGDHRADVVLVYVPTGLALACPAIGTSLSPCVTLATFGGAYELAAIGDVNGDDLGDLAARQRTGAGTVVCSLVAGRLGSCAGLTGVDPRWRLLGAADFDGDHRADLAWRDAAAGLVRIDFLSGLARKGQPLFLPAGPQFRVLAP